ncbi:hypothetical protein EBR56_05440 [bacterium]|nr:hypothetical protein [bacterium]
MMPRRASQPQLSIVIAAPSDVAALEDTLVSVLEKRPPDAEVIVSLGCGYDDPWNIHEEVTFVQAPLGSSLVACTNVGVAASRADVTHILAAGWRATDDWADGPLARFSDDEATVAVVPLTVTADDQARPIASGIRCGCGGRRIEAQPGRGPTHAPALEAGFWRTAFLRQVGPGFATACRPRPTGRRSGDCPDRRPAVRRSIAGSAPRPPPPRRRSPAFIAGLHAERLFWRSLVGQSLPAALAAHFAEVMRHAVARAPLGTLPMLAGRLVALMQFGAYLPRARQLRGLALDARSDATLDGTPTIRIDGPHPAMAAPQRYREVVPLRRSA